MKGFIWSKEPAAIDALFTILTHRQPLTADNVRNVTFVFVSETLPQRNKPTLFHAN